MVNHEKFFEMTSFDICLYQVSFYILFYITYTNLHYLIYFYISFCSILTSSEFGIHLVRPKKFQKILLFPSFLGEEQIEEMTSINQ